MPLKVVGKVHGYDPAASVSEWWPPRAGDTMPASGQYKNEKVRHRIGEIDPRDGIVAHVQRAHMPLEHRLVPVPPTDQ
jgi:hypothetical protein